MYKAVWGGFALDLEHNAALYIISRSYHHEKPCALPIEPQTAPTEPARVTAPHVPDLEKPGRADAS
ncbi:hypothetical protein VM1G_11502 [Cytospora mali]|uniref:Uncharacterized protein n=1 Tax=Cytospora mali TaxID=578113 RepID=A0A194VT99_CYTMA|nr:hypothetical protein VM1G_11502 [Valsa mali]